VLWIDAPEAPEVSRTPLCSASNSTVNSTANSTLHERNGRA
jgi:hypothetical protein